MKLRAGARADRSRVRELKIATRVEFDDERRELVVHFERRLTADAETVIGATLAVPACARARGSAA